MAWWFDIAKIGAGAVIGFVSSQWSDFIKSRRAGKSARDTALRIMRLHAHRELKDARTALETMGRYRSSDDAQIAFAFRDARAHPPTFVAQVLAHGMHYSNEMLEAFGELDASTNSALYAVAQLQVRADEFFAPAGANSSRKQPPPLAAQVEVCIEAFTDVERGALVVLDLCAQPAESRPSVRGMHTPSGHPSLAGSSSPGLLSGRPTAQQIAPAANKAPSDDVNAATPTESENMVEGNWEAMEKDHLIVDLAGRLTSHDPSLRDKWIPELAKVLNRKATAIRAAMEAGDAHDAGKASPKVSNARLELRQRFPSK